MDLGARAAGGAGRLGLAPALLEAAHQRAQIARAQLIEPRLDGGRGAIQPARVLRVGGDLGLRIRVTGTRRLPTATHPLLGGRSKRLDIQAGASRTDPPRTRPPSRNTAVSALFSASETDGE